MMHLGLLKRPKQYLLCLPDRQKKHLFMIGSDIQVGVICEAVGVDDVVCLCLCVVLGIEQTM